MLPILANWLGVVRGTEFWTPDQLRKLLKMVKEISQFKGTRQVLEEVLEIFLGEPPTIIEQFKWHQYSGAKTQNGCENLYGDDANDFTILINKTVNEEVFLQLKNLTEILVPIRAKANIIFLDRCRTLDRYAYADVNAILRNEQLDVAFDVLDKLDSDIALV
jgi:P2-related tail formation protein